MAARYQTLGKTTHFNISIPITTIGTCGSYVKFTLPNTPKSYVFFTGIETSVGTPLKGYSTGTNGVFMTTLGTGAFPGASGYTLELNGTYEAS